MILYELEILDESKKQKLTNFWPSLTILQIFFGKTLFNKKKKLNKQEQV